MRNPRKSADEQYALIIECRSSGLTDQQWCMQHDIKPGTFYNWVKRLRRKACYDIPEATGRAGLTAAVKQDVVKIEVLPDEKPSVVPDNVPDKFPAADTFLEMSSCQTPPIEIRMHEAVLRITNDVDPRLLAQILRNLGGCVC